MRFDCLQMESMPSQKTNKLCTHVHHHDHRATVAIFAKGTYFVDTPRIMTHELQRMQKEAVMAYSETLQWHLLGGNEVHHEKSRSG
jgi:hypothetical protein